MGDRGTARGLIAAGLVLLSSALALWRAAPLDLALHRLLRLNPADPLVRATIDFTAIGGITIAGPIVLVAAAWLWRRRRGAAAAWLVLAVGSGRLVVEAVKAAVRRPRPPAVDQLEFVQSWSFPSAHSAGTTVACVALALLMSPPNRRWALPLALLAALAIGWSRVALAVHWPSDVLAGWGIGLIWVGGAAFRLPRRST